MSITTAGRTISASMVTEVTTAQLSPILMAELNFSTPLYLWSGYGTITYNSIGYLGLGTLAEHSKSLTLPSFLSTENHAPASAWLWKLIFTVVTLSVGFKGGEVTPLFFIGAALGNSLAWWIGAPVDLFAGISMIALFAAATQTPVASIVMGMELLGWKIGIPLTFCTLIALKLSGTNSIYPKSEDL
jgi:H+/Cl- antiporter ClcA